MPLFRRRKHVPPIEIDEDPCHGDAALSAACAGVESGDWTPAKDLLARTGTDHDLRSKYVWTLADHLAEGPDAGIVTVDGRRVVDTTVTWADRWAAAEPDNIDALLVRIRSLISRGWQVRGSDRASTVGRASFEEFHRVLRLATQLSYDAAEVAPDDPGPGTALILLATALGAPREVMEARLAAVLQRAPQHQEAHNFALMYLCQKWQGSHEAMFGYAREVARTAPAGSPLHALTMQAHAEYWLYMVGFVDSKQEGRAMLRAWINDPLLQRDIDNAYENWFRKATEPHPQWYRDLNYLACVSHLASRETDAAPVFEAIGPYAAELPWGWLGNWRTKFQEARAEALRG